MKAFRAALLSPLVLAVSCASAFAVETLTVCLNENAPPYSSRAGTQRGFDFAVANALAHKLGRALEVLWYESKLDEDSSGALEANALLSDRKCDLVAGYPLSEDALAAPGAATARLPDFDGFKPSDRRRRIPLGILLHTKPYHFAPLAVVVDGEAVGKPIAGLNDLDGVKIGAEGGTLSDTILMTYDDGKLIEYITHLVPGRGELLSGMERGEYDAALVPLHRFDAYRAAHAATRLKPSGYLFPVGFNLGFVGLASDAALIAETDAALTQMLASGDIAGLAPDAGMTYLPPREPEVQKHILLGDLKTR